MSMVCGYEPALQSPPATQLTNLNRGASRRTESSRLEQKEGGDGVRGMCQIQAGRENYLVDPRALPTSTTPIQVFNIGPGRRSVKIRATTRHTTPLLSSRTHVAFRPSRDLGKIRLDFDFAELTTRGTRQGMGVFGIVRWRKLIQRVSKFVAGSQKEKHALENVWRESDTAATPCPECRAVDQIGRKYSSYPRPTGFRDARKAEGRHEVKESRACDRIWQGDVESALVLSARPKQRCARIFGQKNDEASCVRVSLGLHGERRQPYRGVLIGAQLDRLCLGDLEQRDTGRDQLGEGLSQRGMGAGDEGENEDETYAER
ncbi:hypothetical protein C8R45DRAFT_942736 [Mycena sanguinolenta]|nr:hypothetical protein C8R45DRAFT_942736 [Mycena sanguinolenta]